jgi:purine-binding chemotaxis protein CheW
MSAEASQDVKVSDENENRFLLFWVGKELYGTPLLDVREVVEFLEPKFMPNMVKHFSGVINIRGSIVGVMDLRKKFGQPQEKSRSTAMLVCDTPQGAIAAVVDRVDSVVTIEGTQLEKKPPVVTQVEQAYLVGVAKVKEQLVTVVKLHQALCDEKLVLASA